MTRVPLADLPVCMAFCDPAAGKNLALKRVRARSAIVVVAQDSVGRIFTLLAWAARCTTDALTAKVFAVNEAFRPRSFGIESNALQSLYGDMVTREARFRERRVPVLEVRQPTNVEKDWRIRTVLQPVIAAGRLFTQPNQHELRAELVSFPMSPTKDLVDALASAVKLLPTIRTPQTLDAERMRHLEYLRDSGAPASYILDVARGHP